MKDNFYLKTYQPKNSIMAVDNHDRYIKVTQFNVTPFNAQGNR